MIWAKLPEINKLHNDDDDDDEKMRPNSPVDELSGEMPAAEPA